jgi:hypothetical protein
VFADFATAAFLSVLMAGASLLIWAPGLALSGLAPTFAQHPALRLAAIPLGSALSGWILFWAWFADPAIGASASILVLASSTVAIALRPQCLTHSDVRYPLAFALMICLAYFCIVGDHDNLLGGSVMVSDRYWATHDNDLPRMFSDRLIEGRAAFPAWLYDHMWKYSDRPPVQTGMVMLAYPFVAAPYAQFAYLMLAMAANGLWIFALWSFLRVFDLPERRIGVAVVSVAMVGAVYINTVYTWPKMLAGALTLTMATMIFLPGGSRRLRSLLSGLLSALAMLAHGAAAFGLIGVVISGQKNLRQWGLINCLVAACVAAACYMPWFGFQKMFDPPGDRLIKWHLAGTSIGDIDPRPPLEAVVSSYAQAGLAGTIVNKIANIRMLLGDPVIYDDWRGWQPLWSGSFAKELRFYLDQRVGGAPGILLIGVFAMFWHRGLLRQPWARATGMLLIASSVTFVVLEFGTEFASTWLIVAPYSIVLLWSVVGAVALVQIDRFWAYAVLIAHGVSFLFLWASNVPSAFREVNSGHIDVGMKVAMLLPTIGIFLLFRNLWLDKAADTGVSLAVRPNMKLKTL